MPRIRRSGTGSSPTNSPGRALQLARTGSNAYARTTASGPCSQRKRGLNREPGPPVHDDLVERDFTAAAPNELWLTDITEHPTAEGKHYLCAVKDVLFREDCPVLDGLDDEILAGGLCAGECGAGPPPGKERGALVPRLPSSGSGLPAVAHTARPPAGHHDVD
jgi:hypothetical protein